MSSIDVLLRQHRSLEELFGRLRDSEGEDRILQLGKLIESLLIHAIVEENYFYPVAQRAGLDTSIERSREEHAEVRRLLGGVSGLDSEADPRLDVLLGRLEEEVRRHVAAEEASVFPRVEARVHPDVLHALGEGLEQELSRLRLLDLRQLLQYETTSLEEPSVTL